MQKTKLGGEFQDERDPGIPDHIKEINELIRKAQNKTGSVSRQIRDESIMKLCEKFKGLIKSIAERVHRKANNVPFDEWRHETLTTFIELLISDYKLKEDGGAAFFGHYITQKLYYRMLDKSQRAVAHHNRQGNFDPTSFEEFGRKTERNREQGSSDFAFRFSTNSMVHDIGISDDGKTRRAVYRETPTEVFNAMVSNFHGASADYSVVEEDRREFIIEEARNILETARRILKPREFQIFHLHYASGMIAKEIEPLLESHISPSRIRFIARNARDRVLVELGRQRVKRTLT